jgi:hypothetical protein
MRKVVAQSLGWRSSGYSCITWWVVDYPDYKCTPSIPYTFYQPFYYPFKYRIPGLLPRRLTAACTIPLFKMIAVHSRIIVMPVFAAYFCSNQLQVCARGIGVCLSSGCTVAFSCLCVGVWCRVCLIAVGVCMPVWRPQFYYLKMKLGDFVERLRQSSRITLYKSNECRRPNQVPQCLRTYKFKATCTPRRPYN